jgi:glycosidase
MPDKVFGPEVERVCRDAAVARSVSVAVDGKQVEIRVPFASPADWRDTSIYFVMVDRFENPNAAPRRAPFDGAFDTFQGGKLEGIRKRLGYISRLGAGAIWLSPVLKNCQFEDTTYHGYGIQDFLQLDPRFASDPSAARANPALVENELRQLIDEAHARGLYVIMDVVLNHTGNVFDYDGFGAAAPFSPHPYPIHWRGADGEPAFSSFAVAPQPIPRDAAVWPAELQSDAFFRRQGKGDEAAGDFESLKELVTEAREATALGERLPVHSLLIRAYQYLIARFDIDGYRIDTLKFIEPAFARKFGNAMREYALSIGKRDFFTFGEIFDDERKIARFIGRDASATEQPIGVDAALDFPLFFQLPGVVKGFIPPRQLAETYQRRVDVQRGLITSHGEASGHFVTFLDNHDMRERFYFDDGSGQFNDQALMGFACLYALQGIPCVYYGTEQGLHGRGGADLNVREALWGKPSAFDERHRFYVALAKLSRLRTAQPALRYGRQYFRQVSGDGVSFGFSPFAPGVIAFSRILNDQEVILVANTAAGSAWTGEVIIDAALSQAGAQPSLLYSNRAAPTPPSQVLDKVAGSVRIENLAGGTTDGPARTIRVQLAPQEAQIIAPLGR